MLAGFASTSSDFKVAKQFANNNFNQYKKNCFKVILVVQNYENHEYEPIPIDKLSEFPTENEYLMRLNSFLKITGIE